MSVTSRTAVSRNSGVYLPRNLLTISPILGLAVSDPWPRCVNCRTGTVINDQTQSPIPRSRYRSDWTEFSTWCTTNGIDPLPAAAASVTGYLTMLANAGAKVGTMSRRLAAIKFAHRTADLPDPTDNVRVITVWEGSAAPTPLPPTKPPH